MIEPIKKESATDIIFNQLLDAILSGVLPVGSKIPSEAVLAEQFGVSRAPVREALQRLNAMGIITSQQGRGSFVNPSPASSAISSFLSLIGEKDNALKDLLEYRLLVEPYCAQYMALNHDEKKLKELAKYSPDPETLGDANLESVFELDVSFHSIIVNGVDNSIIRFVQQYSSEMMKDHVRFFLDIHNDPMRVAREHYSIYKAIEAGDGNKASSIMKQHIIYVVHLLERRE